MARYAVIDSISPCSLPISSIGNGEITTIESLSEDGDHSVQQAWLKYDVAQSSYRRAGQIMSAAALLKSNANPSDEEIEATMNENLCRCGTYLRIRKAIKTATNT